MAEYNSEILNVIRTRLIPKMEAVSLEIAAIEPYSYDGQDLMCIRRESEYYSMLYDFLYEYASGLEEIDNDKLINIVRLIEVPDSERKLANSTIRIPIRKQKHTNTNYRLFINDVEFSSYEIVQPDTTLSIKIEYTTSKNITGTKSMNTSIDTVHQIVGSYTYITTKYVPTSYYNNYLIITANAKENSIALDSGAIWYIAVGTNALLDKDGNPYETITIGTQEWIIPNLRTTTFANGNPISNITDNNDWVNGVNVTANNYGTLYNWYAATKVKSINVSDYGALYNYIAISKNTQAYYGRLYNYYAANYSIGGASIAPIGWHVPTFAEWDALCVFIGGGHLNSSGGADMLREIGTTHWLTPNTTATNSTGFTSVGTGYRSGPGGGGGITGSFHFLKFYGMYTIANYSTGFLGIGTGNNLGTVGGIDMNCGCAIRLLKDTTTLSDKQTSTMTDYDDNIYKTVCIGTQEWMAANLCVEHYNDGTPIPIITDNNAWASDTVGAMCYYNNNSAYAFTPIQNCFAPSGWHVPTSSEWTSLSNYVGNGGHLKEAGLAHWDDPNTDADNSTNFTALGSGYRNSSDGIFSKIKLTAYYWNGNSYDSTNGYISKLYYDSTLIDNDYADINNALSVRLIKDDSNDEGTVTDYDGNIYDTITIGSQVWTKQNFKCTHYNNGIVIPELVNNADWITATDGAMCYYVSIFNAFNPIGWHVPTQEEFETLSITLGGDTESGIHLKETGLVHWNDPNVANNSSGFSAVGSGHRGFTDGSFYNIKDNTMFWVSDASFMYYMQNDSSILYMLSIESSYGFSVRLIKDDDTWIEGDTMLDNDGASYPTVKIGNQVWMAKNLNQTKYNDLTTIPNITDNTEWVNDVNGAMCYYNNDTSVLGPAYCWYNNDITNKTPYGAMYNSLAINSEDGLAYFTRKGVQELGWRIPIDNDFYALADLFGGMTSFGVKLKEVGSIHWVSNNDGTNESQFTAVGNGLRDASTGIFGFLKALLSLEGIATTELFVSGSDGTIATITSGAQTHGAGVRCVKGIYTLPMPTLVGVDEITSISLRVHWNDIPYNVIYFIEIASDIDFTSIFTSGESLSSNYNVNGLLPNTTYYYRVLAYDSLTSSAWVLGTVDTSSIVIKNGNLYNFYAVNDLRGFAPIGWHIPSLDEVYTLAGGLGGFTVAGGPLKDIDLSYWNTPNTGATNSTGFSARGTGQRIDDGSFIGLMTATEFWTSDTYEDNTASEFALLSDSEILGAGTEQFTVGLPVRLIKDDDVDPITMTDNDGHIYDTVKIGDQVWTKQNMITSQYRTSHIDSYGKLYNYTVASASGNLVTAGWELPTTADISNIITIIGGSDQAIKLKAIGSQFWDDGGGTDIYEFNAIGTGVCNPNSGFSEANQDMIVWLSSTFGSNQLIMQILGNNISPSMEGFNTQPRNAGCAIRLVWRGEGVPTECVDYDGYYYEMCQIGDTYWMAENLKTLTTLDGNTIEMLEDVSMFSNQTSYAAIVYDFGKTIPEVIDATTWSTLTTGAKCSYNNDTTNSQM